jgi:hypothetical protein
MTSGKWYGDISQYAKTLGENYRVPFVVLFSGEGQQGRSRCRIATDAKTGSQADTAALPQTLLGQLMSQLAALLTVSASV